MHNTGYNAYKNVPIFGLSVLMRGTVKISVIILNFSAHIGLDYGLQMTIIYYKFKSYARSTLTLNNKSNGKATENDRKPGKT